MINLKTRAEGLLKSGKCNNNEILILNNFLRDVENEEFIEINNVDDVDILFINDEDYIDNIIDVLEVMEDVEERLLTQKFRGVQK